ncbi:unnamed protein product [Ectocarpus sp. CCAP 1310/34]|nr:unnamed protein product [Ectocarpus sp. CCAP 1310/34]
MADLDAFEQSPPSTPQQEPQLPPPPPPPRDINPFGQPATPESKEGNEVDLNASLEPPRPSTPPPPPPIPAREAAGSEHSEASAAAPVLSPRPPSSPPPPLPGGGGGPGVGALGSAAVAAATAAVLASGTTRKRKALDETRTFEQRRHSHFGEKYDGDSLYWKCFVELIRRSQANNRRAISYATQKLSATHAYAKSLYAIRDRVDSLEPGTTEALREKERRKNNHKKWPPQQLPLPPQQRRGSGTDAGGLPPQPASALDCLFEMEEWTAMRTIDMCQEAHVTVIDNQLNAMVKKLDERFAEMVGQGTACLRLMHSAEMNSVKAYGRYQEIVTASLEREASPARATAPLTLRDVAGSDIWLADMNYRVAVTQQARVWKGVSAKLGDLFGKMKDIEVERRKAIQGGLTAMVQLQDALWRDLPALKDPVLHTLDRINVDRHLLDQEVRQQMRVGAARLLAGRQENGASAGAGGGGPNEGASGGAPAGATAADAAATASGGGGSVERSETIPPDFLAGLESPLASSLIV